MSVQTTVVSGTVWQQFEMKFLTWDREPPVWGVLIVTMYRFRSAPSYHGRTDRQTELV